MKPALLFLVKFICLTAPLIWLWRAGGLAAYHAVYSPVAETIYGWFGLEGVATPARDRYINIIPFVTLMVLTPRLSLRRRLGGTAIGLLILFAMHIGVNLTAHPKTLALPRNIRLMLDAAPFFLWIIIANEFVTSFLKWADANTEPETSDKNNGD